ncbi:hypothetical protein PENDEC_c002G02251 [Penicillium decumbens]|uniref:ATPase inhibitor, mitochondrial n=1 Tax=Penicillium decumbens TaxID=69771 RepID=A0A1V6PKG2_PENDC|nr:hypothetical protein PENDEC_c002G02251 [Penicillium decumbens]
MGEGDTGIRSDVFTKREAAEEAMYVKKKEMERLSGLKAKLKERKEQEESDKSVYEHDLFSVIAAYPETHVLIDTDRIHRGEQIKNQRGVHN